MSSVDRVEVEAALPRIKNVNRVGPVRPRQKYSANGQLLPMFSANSDGEVESKEELGQAMESVAGYVQTIARDINFRIDEETDKYVVTVTDEESGEVIRQIPNEEMLEISRHLDEELKRDAGKILKGLLFQVDA